MIRRSPCLVFAHLARVSHTRGGLSAAIIAAAASTAAAQPGGWEATTVLAGPPVRSAPSRLAPGPKYKSAQVMAPAAAPAADIPEEKAAPAKAASPPAPGARDYCINIVDAAADARFALQRKMLEAAGEEIDKRIALLEEKTAEFKKWLARRDDFSKKANETVLSIYSRMRPDAAALQLAALDEETAAAVLTKLQPRLASLILNEMDVGQAARLTATIVGSGKVLPAAPKSAKVEAAK